jgi:hypothetical protein
MHGRTRSGVALAAGAVLAATVLVATVALPVVGQDPSPSTAPAATEKPGNGPKADRGPKAAKAPKVPEVALSVTGRVGTRTDAEGAAEYILTAAGTVYVLHVGPPWWWGNAHPLKDLVGDIVTITGEGAQGSSDIDVFTVNGTTVRESGRPPWAGGWKAVGERHPGWARWKVDKLADKAQGKGTGRPPWAGPRTPATSGG